MSKTTHLYIFTTRNKIFMLTEGSVHHRLALAKGGPHKVPNWIKRTKDYEFGLKDKSIVDVTPEPEVVVVNETTKLVTQSGVDGATEAPVSDSSDDVAKGEPQPDDADNSADDSTDTPASQPKGKKAPGIVSA